MTMYRLNFSTNWNNKLYCKCFTTVRLYNSKRYYKGAEFEVFIQNKSLGKARVKGVRMIYLDELDNYITMLDTGYPVDLAKGIFERMYKNKVTDWRTQPLAWVLLEYLKT